MRIKLSDGTWLALADDMDQELVRANIAAAEDDILSRTANKDDSFASANESVARRGRPRAN